jgi:hypothetical protein
MIDLILEAKQVDDMVYVSEDYFEEGEYVFKNFSINEFGNVIFIVDMIVQSSYHKGDSTVGEQSYREFESVDINLNQIQDSEGELISFNEGEKTEIEEILKRRLLFLMY